MDKYRDFKSGIGLLTVLVMIAALFALTGGSASADTNGCPNGGIGNPKTSSLVGASFTVSADTATYTFQSFSDQSPTGGVPGLIEYCIYPGTQPDSVSTLAVGDDSSAWSDPPGFDNFSFQRSDGNPSNIGLDGTTHTMGTATWNSGVPTLQPILLHINDAAECDALYGGNPGTCFVLPGGGGGNEAQAPSVTKDAKPSFDRSFTWTISKDACKHGTSGVNCVQRVNQVGGTVTFDYSISVGHGSGTDGNWKVDGKITVTNPNSDDITGVNLTDSVDNGGTCSVTNGTNLTVPGSDFVQRSYECTYSSAPSPSNGTNTGTATWPEQTLSPSGDHLAAGITSGTATFDFGSTTPSLIDDCVHVTDPNAPNPPLPADVCGGDSNPTTFTYSKTVTVPQFDCTSVTNTATFTTDDTGATGSASQTVTVCGPLRTGALTMGFWQNKNGQAIIGSYGGTNCQALRTWLNGFNPFADLTAADCTGVKLYVTNVIKAANAKGAAMNAMLKAQDLSTSLDVYFSDSTLGGNRIGAPTPIGAQKIDLTLICKMIDGSGGTATCSGTFYDTSSVFGNPPNGTCQTVLALLTYAASQSNAGGTSWYAQVKATQEKAKNTFDAINNQVAFGC